MTDRTRVGSDPETTEREVLLAEIASLRGANELLRTYAYTAAHELGAPARRVLMHLDLLVSTTDPEAYANRVGKLRESAVALASLVSDLLDLASLEFEAFSKDRVSLDNLIRLIFEEATSALAEDVQLLVEPAPETYGNETLLRRLFSNLADNAVKFRRPDVPLEIEIRSKELPDGDWIITITDNGVGIGDDKALSMFQPLVRLRGRSEYPGSGIGLAVCRRIVQWHGGSISARSNTNGVGTSIEVHLGSS